MLKVNLSSSEIFLYGMVGTSMFDDGFTDLEVVDALAKLGGRKAIVRINSPGGSADQGIAIYNALKRHKAGVETIVDAMAASAASIIALAGDKRTSSLGSKWMIHQALSFDVGNADQLRKTADILDVYDASLVEIYKKHMKTDANILDMMKAETWFTAKEAMDQGLATHIDGESVETPKIASWFKNPPAALVAEAKNRKDASRSLYRKKIFDMKRNLA